MKREKTMIFEIRSKKDLKIRTMYNRAMKQLEPFFGFRWTRNKPRVFIVYDRQTIDVLRHGKTEDWIVAWEDKRGVYFLDGGSYKKHSCHKYSEKRFANTMKHELAHAFTFIITNGKMSPVWLAEGVAEYASGKKISAPKRFFCFLDFYSKWGKEGYQESYYAVNLLIKKYGKKKLFTLLKSLQKIKNQAQFNKLFNKIYGFRSSYKKFNEMLKNDSK